MISGIINNWELKLAQKDVNRRVLPFDWGVEFLEPDAPVIAANGNINADARRAVFDFNDRAIATSDHLFRSRVISDFSYDVDWVSFSSPLASPYPENNTVHARYFPVRAAGENGRPGGDAATDAS